MSAEKLDFNSLIFAYDNCSKDLITRTREDSAIETKCGTPTR